MRVSLRLFLIKSSLFPLIFAFCSLPLALALSLILVLTYRFVISWIMGFAKPMPGMDMATFLGIPSATVNVQSAIVMENTSAKKMKERFRQMMLRLPKMRYCIKEVLGDYYYKEMPIHETIDIVF